VLVPCSLTWLPAERKQQLAERMAEGTALLEQLQRLQTHAPAAAELAEAEGEVADLEDELVQVHCM
jgi:predicted nuclease with TOPRIM domain